MLDGKAIFVGIVSDVTDHKLDETVRKAVHDLNPDRFLIEALVDPELDQKIDVLDQETHCAYEFKVSGKNAQS